MEGVPFCSTDRVKQDEPKKDSTRSKDIFACFQTQFENLRSYCASENIPAAIGPSNNVNRFLLLIHKQTMPKEALTGASMSVVIVTKYKKTTKQTCILLLLSFSLTQKLCNMQLCKC